MNALIHSQLYVLSVCTSLQCPVPTTDTALTLIMYSVPAFSPVRLAEVLGGKTAVLQNVAPLFLYCTWYCEMVTSLWAVVHMTVIVGVTPLTGLVREMFLIFEGTVRER